MKWKKSKNLIFTGIIVLVCATIFFGTYYIKKSMHGEFPQGTYVAGIDISGKTLKESEEMLNEAAEAHLDKKLEIQLGETAKEISLREFGAEVLVRETVQTLKQIDAREISIFRLLGPKKTEEVDTPLIVNIGYDQIYARLDEAFDLAGKEPSPASFYFEGRALRIKEEKEGKVLDLEAAHEEIERAAKTLTAKKITLTLSDKEPSPKKEELEEQKDRLQEALKHEFSLIDPIYSEDWHLRLYDHLDWVEFKRKQLIVLPPFSQEIVLDEAIEDLPEGTIAKTFIAIEIKQEKLDEFLDAEVAKWLDIPADSVNIYRTEEGEIKIEGYGHDGLEIRRKALKKAIELAVENNITEVPIPVVRIRPKTTISEELRELGIKERVAVGHTSYYGSPANRVHNIKVGAEQINGTLIEPGGTFSFNETIGVVDETTGYREELVIKPEGTIPEYGGGLCQVSTTVYRAALFSGMPIVERNQHSYAVSYYSQVLGHGLDATIYLGGADLKFTNETDQHMLIQMYVDKDYELYVILYGTDDGREVKLEGPYLSNYHKPGDTIYEETDQLRVGQTEQVEKPHTGFDALWKRYILFADGEQKEETIETSYKAIPGKVLTGVGE